MNWTYFLGVIAFTLLYVVWQNWREGPSKGTSTLFPLIRVWVDFDKTELAFENVTVISNSFVTFLTAKQVTQNGFKSPQIVGWLEEPNLGIVPGNVILNTTFKNRVHTIAATLSKLPTNLVQKAQQLQVGQVELVDDRKSQSQPSSNDIIGYYTVENGKIIDYTPNPDFVFFSETGDVDLVDFIRDELYSKV